MELKEEASETDHWEKSCCVYLNPSDPLIIDETCFFPFFWGGGVSSHTRSDQKGPRRTAAVLSQLRVCWEIIWHHGARRWLDGEGKKKAETDGARKKKKEPEGRGWEGVGDDQFSTPVSIMSSPVRTDLRIKLLRDLPELRCDRYSGNVYPDLTDVCHRVTLNMTRPSASLSHTLPSPHVHLNRP